MSIQVIECLKEYPMVGSTVNKGLILTENPQASKEEFDGTVFISEKGIKYHFNNSEIVFSQDIQKSFKLLRRKI